jgi:hypothetical protein
MCVVSSCVSCIESQHASAVAAACRCCVCVLQRQQSMQPERHKVVVSTDGLMPSTSASYADEEDHKYTRRAHPLKRTLQRLFPNMFSPGLPITNRCVYRCT